MEKLTQELLKEILDYNPETGIFTWKISKQGIKNKIAGSLKKEGYWRIGLYKKQYLAHRLAFLWMEGYIPENGIDHIDRDKQNNKWNNLREVSQSCNMRNQSTRNDNKIQITGVCLDKKTKKWRSQISIPKKIYLGSFNNILEAVRARWEAVVKYNFPYCITTSSAYNYLKENGGL